MVIGLISVEGPKKRQFLVQPLTLHRELKGEAIADANGSTWGRGDPGCTKTTRSLKEIRDILCIEQIPNANLEGPWTDVNAADVIEHKIAINGYRIDSCIKRAIAVAHIQGLQAVAPSR